MTNRFVEKLRGFSPLADADVAELVALTSRSRVSKTRHDLICEGDRPGPVFVMIEGWACRYKILSSGTRQVLAFLMLGDACDLHIGLLAEMDHSIQTITPARFATIERVDMDELMIRRPAIAKAMYIAQLVDEGTMRAWITSMGRRTSIERVAHLMCELYLRARDIAMTGEATLTLPLSQVLLADALGMTSVHINRVLEDLRIAGAMTLHRGSLEVSDPDKLVRIAGFDDGYLHRRTRLA
ncbi:MAG: Crp/Fnr family transcriptional regulator [Pseudomonas sp.]|nr:MAG: Crp/Fnr family transcriptional regulator [Pseudomonas sp.]